MYNPNQQQQFQQQQVPMYDNQSLMPNVQMQPMNQQGQQIINQQQVQANTMQLCQASEFPISVYCTHCQQQVTTEIEYKRGSGSFFCCLMLTVFIGCCCCIPLFNKKCQDKIHHCPKCQSVFGINEYKPFNRKGRRQKRSQ